MGKNKTLCIGNKTASLEVNPEGGAITDFHLTKNKINPLSFAFTKEQMPQNNKAGAPYRGHFICCPYWGLPSAGEIKKGFPNHGAFANMKWQIKKKTGHFVAMKAGSKKEGLSLKRKISISTESAIIKVEEEIKNINSFSRLYNIVQHPTLAMPFLDNSILIHSNATAGFNQAHYKNAEKQKTIWPFVKDEKEKEFNITKPSTAANGVYSFIINPAEKFGWITAYSAKNNLLFGYIFERADYPWINIWKHGVAGKVQYLGIEFGTTGIHQPFDEIIKSSPKLFNENCISVIDADETIKKKYWSFLIETGEKIKLIKSVLLNPVLNCVTITTDESLYIIQKAMYKH